MPADDAPRHATPPPSSDHIDAPHERSVHRGPGAGSHRGKAPTGTWSRRLYLRRPDGLGDPRLFPNRRRAGLSPSLRLELQVRREELYHRLTDLESAMVSGADERLDLLDELEEIRDTLWPAIPWQRGRRPPAFDRSPLPPTATEPRVLSGQQLRQACLLILARHGELPLVEIHAWLHRYGYAVAGSHPVKVLADALGHEHDAGRATRVARGVYDLAIGHAPPLPGVVDLAGPDGPATPGSPSGRGSDPIDGAPDPSAADPDRGTRLGTDGDESTTVDPLTEPPLWETVSDHDRAPTSAAPPATSSEAGRSHRHRHRPDLGRPATAPGQPDAERQSAGRDHRAGHQGGLGSSRSSSLPMPTLRRRGHTARPPAALGAEPHRSDLVPGIDPTTGSDGRALTAGRPRPRRRPRRRTPCGAPDP